VEGKGWERIGSDWNGRDLKEGTGVEGIGWEWTGLERKGFRGIKQPHFS